MIFENQIKTDRREFLNKVTLICGNLQIPIPDWLMFVMWFETAHTLDHTIVNFQRGDNPDPNIRCYKRASGAIQFMPRTAISLGITNYDLIHMSFIEQLDYVEKYLKPYKGKYHSFVDLYLAIFYPVMVGKPDTYTIKSDIIAKQNPIFDVNNDLDITKKEIKIILRNSIPNNYRDIFY